MIAATPGCRCLAICTVQPCNNAAMVQAADFHCTPAFLYQRMSLIRIKLISRWLISFAVSVSIIWWGAVEMLGQQQQHFPCIVQMLQIGHELGQASPRSARPSRPASMCSCRCCLSALCNTEILGMACLVNTAFYTISRLSALTQAKNDVKFSLTSNICCL